MVGALTRGMPLKGDIAAPSKHAQQHKFLEFLFQKTGDEALSDRRSDSCEYEISNWFYDLRPIGNRFNYTNSTLNEQGDALYFSFCHNLPVDAFIDAGCNLKQGNINQTTVLLKKAGGDCYALTQDSKDNQANYIQSLARDDNT